MRTTLILPDQLLEQARTTLGFRCDTDTVIYALREVVRRGRSGELLGALGKVQFEFDPTELRKKDRAEVAVDPPRA
jgi:Arc/MetJ family transcription regulator